ncbi:MAG: DUF488 domain-containing protein [Sedimentisphaerales bacterium]|jgi:uncharacterized protein YeaO (DUF488 family)
MRTAKTLRAEQVRLKRAYDGVSGDDGYRILVDRVWPRGVSKRDLRVDEWLKDIAPSTELRKWFGHDPGKWDEFRKRYFQELTDKEEVVEAVRDKMRHHRVTFVYSAKDREFNNAVALKEYLENRGRSDTPL